MIVPVLVHIGSNTSSSASHICLRNGQVPTPVMNTHRPATVVLRAAQLMLLYVFSSPYYRLLMPWLHVFSHSVNLQRQCFDALTSLCLNIASGIPLIHACVVGGPNINGRALLGLLLPTYL